MYIIYIYRIYLCRSLWILESQEVQLMLWSIKAMFSVLYDERHMYIYTYIELTCAGLSGYWKVRKFN